MWRRRCARGRGQAADRRRPRRRGRRPLRPRGCLRPSRRVPLLSRRLTSSDVGLINVRAARCTAIDCEEREMEAAANPAPKAWHGRFYEDLEVGDVYRSRLGRTVTETDNVWFTCLTLNTNQVHFNDAYAARTLYGKVLVNSTFTLGLIPCLTVCDPG